MSQTIAAALTTEHHIIDGEIENFVSDLKKSDGEIPATGALMKAFEALKRHIYLEEEFVFPKLKAAGLFMALQVMYREHGTIWAEMENIIALLNSSETKQKTDLLAACEKLVGVLDSHNEKEEPVIYPHIDEDLNEAEAAKLKDFIASGKMPENFRPKM